MTEDLELEAQLLLVVYEGLDNVFCSLAKKEQMARSTVSYDYFVNVLAMRVSQPS